MNWQAFKVVRDNKEINYIGLMVSLIEGIELDLYNLSPDKSYTSRIGLHNEYDLSRSGTYTITYEGFWLLPDENGNEELFFVSSNNVEFTLKKGIHPNYERKL